MDTRSKRYQIVDEITSIIERRVCKAIQWHIDRYGCLVAQSSSGRSIGPLDTDIADLFGAQLTGYEITDDTTLRVYGTLSEPITSHLPENLNGWRFEISAMADGVSDHMRFYSANSFDSLHLDPSADKITNEILQDTLDTIKLHDVQWRLMGDDEIP